MATREVLALNTTTPQIEAPQAGDTYYMPRVVEITAGSAAAPALVATGDINTGVWFPAADTLAASTAGVERLRISSTGNVAVGTAAAVQGPERAAPERVAPRQPVAAHGAHIDVRPHIRKASAANVASLARACSKLSKNAFAGPFPPVLLKMTWLQELCALAALALEPPL